MPKFTICVEMLFNNLPFLNRLEKVKDAGVTAFEFWDWTSKDIDAIVKKKSELDLDVSTFNASPRIPSLTRLDVKDEFVSSVEASIKVAKRLDCDNLIAPVGLGQPTPGLPQKKQLRNAIENLKAVVPLIEKSEIRLLIEPVNPVDHKGFFLRKSADAAYVIRNVGSSYVKMLYDFYQQQLTEGNLINNAKSYLNLIGFFHVGDVPGRHEPGTGEINYRNIFRFIEESGYDGYVSLEFMPTGDHTEAIRKTIELAAFHSAAPSLNMAL